MYALVILMISSLSFSTVSPPTKPASLFDGDEMLHLSLAFSMSKLMANRTQDADYQIARLSSREEFTSKDIQLRIKTRGNFRLSPENCAFPPITLNFNAKNTEGSIFEGQNKLKLVTHCQEEKYVLKEYLAYKAYNMINPNSFRVRLAKITYIDLDQSQNSFSKFAFIIEDKDALAERLGGEIIDRSMYNAEAIIRDQTTLLFAFQYLLGNRDWDLRLAKNIKLIQFPDQKILAVPYDFDFTGWVAATYTVQYMGALAKDFEYRIKRTLCRSEAEWQTCFAQYLAQEEALYKLINEFEWLGKKDKKDLVKYIQAFYEDIKDPQKWEELFGAC